jgi:hypothetical protein
MNINYLTIKQVHKEYSGQILRINEQTQVSSSLSGIGHLLNVSKKFFRILFSWGLANVFMATFLLIRYLLGLRNRIKYHVYETKDRLP